MKASGFASSVEPMASHLKFTWDILSRILKDAFNVPFCANIGAS